MTMVSTGEISLGGSATSGGLNRSVNLELGRSATASINMNESAVRTLAGVPSGAISMSNFYGTSSAFSFTISSNQANVDLRTAAINAGWNQSSSLTVNINSGVTIFSNSTGSPAMTISGSFPNGVRLNNSGTILGRGGAGGTGAPANSQTPAAGGAGGLALSVSTAVAINNTGRIAGGGGGGGGGQRSQRLAGKAGAAQAAGGGGGGGIGNGSGGAGGAPIGGGAGQVGAPGTLTTNGTGGAGGTQIVAGFVATGGTGGHGGMWGSAGNTGGIGDPDVWGSGGAGGSGGGAVAGNANITWIAFGTRNGGIS